VDAFLFVVLVMSLEALENAGVEVSDGAGALAVPRDTDVLARNVQRCAQRIFGRDAHSHMKSWRVERGADIEALVRMLTAAGVLAERL
jgi:hypothetical protein